MRRTDWWFAGGVLLFITGAALVLGAITRASDGFVVVGLVAMVGAVVCFGIGSWMIYAGVDRHRIEAERRLRESGVLGRTWLRIRRTLFGRH